MTRPPLLNLSLLVLASGLTGCSLFEPHGGPPAKIKYVGSSTVAHFVRDAEPVYKRATFEIDTKPESEGGEKAILEGTTELAGVANQPRPQTLRAGVAATEIGRDAIAVIVSERNPVTGLTLSQLRSVFTGKTRNWKALGGPDLPIEPFIVGLESATRKVFRSVALRGEDYADCEEIRPDRDIIAAVRKAPGGIGHISFSFLQDSAGPNGVHAVAVDGEEPSVSNFRYPIARPLFLLWREGNEAIEDFVEWAQTEAGQQVVMQAGFVGIRVVLVEIGPPREGEVKRGALIVYTETYPVYDGGIYYYPHRAYDILTRHGKFIRRVRNHLGENDEKPTKVELGPEIYLIRPETSGGERPEFFVEIQAGRTTRFDVNEQLKASK